MISDFSFFTFNFTKLVLCVHKYSSQNVFVPPGTKWKLWGKIQYCYKNWKEDSIKKSKRGSFLQPKQTSRELSSRLLWLWKTVEKTCSNLSNYSWWIIAATTYCSASSLEFAAIFCKNPLSLYFNPRIKLVKWVASVSALLPNTSTKTKVLSTLVVFI